jgi:hypothetical protein
MVLSLPTLLSLSLVYSQTFKKHLKKLCTVQLDGSKYFGNVPILGFTIHILSWQNCEVLKLVDEHFEILKLPYFEDFFLNCQIWTIGSSIWPKNIEALKCFYFPL